MQTKTKILFIRHAESEFNYAMRVAANSNHEVPLEQEDLGVKFSPDLIDCSLSTKGVQQCHQKKNELSQIHIDIVLVSPLLRAVETAHHLFADHPSQPKFIAEPYLREMLLSSCDLGSKLPTTIQKYPYIDFSRVKYQDEPELWNLNYMQNPETVQQLKQYIEKQTDKEKSKQQDKYIKYITSAIGNDRHILQYMSQLHPRLVEDFEENRQRVQITKQVLREEFIKKFPQGTKFACVAHSRLLNTLSCENFDESGNALDGIWWQNCDAIEMEI